MKPLRNVLDKLHPLFDKGGKFEKLYPLYEMADTFLYTPADVNKGSVHVKDAIDLKRTMITVVVALTPCILWALYNTGLQANTALQAMGAVASGWRADIMTMLGVGFDPSSCLANMLHGALYFFPLFLVTNLVGGICEATFSLIRGHEINEGFLVTGMLFPLTLPPTMPLWQAAMGIAFGVVIGKEVFGGTGKNFLNPALTGRAFLYFAYPAQITGDTIWTAVDGFSGATPLGVGALEGIRGISESITFMQAFWGNLQGSMGEGSAFACILGALILIGAKIGSWRIMLGCVAGAFGSALLLNTIGSETNPMFSVPAHWHLVLGGFAFGVVFMATDPVSAALTNMGKLIYGALIGVMTILIRVVNPAFPEGIMLAILFGNTFAPLIDYYVVRVNIRRRELRSA